MKKTNFLRKLTLLVLLAALLFPCMPFGVAAEQLGGSCSQSVKWKLDTATGQLTIYGTGDMPGFSYHTQPYADYKGQIKSIVVEPGITSIGGYAFTYCRAVEQVTLPDGITSIGEFAFADHKITEIEIPDSVQTIGGYAFSGCGYLETVKLPQGLTKIPSSMFDDCSSLKYIEIPASVTTVGYCAFSGCDSLEAVYIQDLEAWCRILFDESDASPSNPLRYAHNLYLNGELVTEVEVPEGITSLDETFANCTSLKRASLPASMTTVGRYAFRDCKNLEAILIRDAVTTIDTAAFEGCENLGTVCYTGTQEQWNQITIGGTNYPLLDAQFHYEFTGSLEDVVPEAADPYSGSCNANVKWKYDPETKTLTISGTGDMPGFSYHTQPYADYKGQIKSIVVEPGITSIGGYAFTYCRAVEQVTLPDGITSIGEFAFADHKITEIEIPDSVQTIGGYAFSGCGYLETVKLPQGLTKIPSSMFDDCSSLEYIEIPASVTTVGYCAFSGCDSLEAVYIQDLEAWCRILFDESDASPSNPLRYAGRLYLNGELVTEVEVPEGITSLDETFANCSSLKRVVLPAGLTEIGTYTFKNCRNLREIVIPESVTKIGRAAFFNCHELDTVHYTGTQEQWNAITIGNENYPLLDAEFRIGFTGEFADSEEVDRLFGSHRWETSIRVADAMKENLGLVKFDAIIIASGNDFADALAGSYLATAKNAPILLSWGKGGSYAYLDNNNIDYVKANLAEGGTVYILGGKNAVPELYESALQGYNVKRLGGANRFETNLLILEAAGVEQGEEILVCTSTNFADSLSASATGQPILLVWNEGGMLFDNQKAFLSGLNGGNTFCVIGGESAVSRTLMNTIGSYGTTTRLAGSNRFETSVKVAKKYFNSPNSVVLAYAWNYPDGLCGGALAYTMDAPLILTMTGFEDQAEAYIYDNIIQDGIVLGGEGLIAEASVRNIFDMKR